MSMSERVCSTCKHYPSDEYCKGCIWEYEIGNTHWEPKDQFINKPCVSEKACHEDKMQVLEKIRAEIEEYKSRQLPLGIGVADLEEGKQVALEYVLAILDTYMVESEK